MGKTKDLSKDCKNIVLNLFKFFQLEKTRGRPLYSPYSSVYRVVNGKSPPESNRPKEIKLLMILTVALLNGPFIACTTVSKIKKLKMQLKSRNQCFL